MPDKLPEELHRLLIDLCPVKLWLLSLIQLLINPFELTTHRRCQLRQIPKQPLFLHHLVILLKFHKELLQFIILLIYNILVVEEPAHQDEYVEAVLDDQLQFEIVLGPFGFVLRCFILVLGFVWYVPFRMAEDLFGVLFVVDLEIESVDVGDVVFEGFDWDCSHDFVDAGVMGA